jgi:hypothetical protein
MVSDKSEGIGNPFADQFPGVVDQQLRQAIQFCWMTMPPDRKSIDEVEKEVKLLIERAFRDLREDAKRQEG